MPYAFATKPHRCACKKPAYEEKQWPEEKLLVESPFGWVCNACHEIKEKPEEKPRSVRGFYVGVNKNLDKGKRGLSK